MSKWTRTDDPMAVSVVRCACCRIALPDGVRVALCPPCFQALRVPFENSNWLKCQFRGHDGVWQSGSEFTK